MLDKLQHAKVCDFGLSKPYTLSKEILGDLSYLFKGDAPDSTHSADGSSSSMVPVAPLKGVWYKRVKGDNWGLTRRNKAPYLVACKLQLLERGVSAVPALPTRQPEEF